MTIIELSRSRWKETPHTHCIMALNLGRPIADPKYHLIKTFDEATTKQYWQAIHRFDNGRGGKKSKKLIEELASKLGYDAVKWVD